MKLKEVHNRHQQACVSKQFAKRTTESFRGLTPHKWLHLRLLVPLTFSSRQSSLQLFGTMTATGSQKHSAALCPQIGFQYQTLKRIETAGVLT